MWVADAGLLKEKTVGIDATTLEANAALRSNVRRDTGEGYDAFLHDFATASSIPTPALAELARLDRKRRKNGSNKDWTVSRVIVRSRVLVLECANRGGSARSAVVSGAPLSYAISPRIVQVQILDLGPGP